MRHATLIVLRPVFLSQHFSCSDFCRARPLPAHKRAHIRMSAPSRRSRRTSKLKRKGQRKCASCADRCASCADSRKPRTTLTERIETKPPVRRRPPRRTCPRATANPLRQRHLSKGSRPKATAFAFLRPGKTPEACTVTSVRVFARRGGAAGVEAKCLHDFVQAFATVALQRKRCGTLVRSHRKTGAATSDDAPFTAKQKRSEKAQFAGRKGEICNESPCFCAAWRSRRSGSKMPARFRAGIRDRRLAKKAVRDTCPLTPQNRRCDLGRRTAHCQAKTQRADADRRSGKGNI